MKVIVKKVSNGLLLNATEEQQSKATVLREAAAQLSKKPGFCNEADEQQKRWLAEKVVQLQMHYAERDDVEEDAVWPVGMIEFLIRDLFEFDNAAMRRLEDQISTWRRNWDGNEG